MDEINDNKKKVDIAQIINWILTIIFIIALAFAVNQKVFEAQNCESFCKSELSQASVEVLSETYICDINWTNVLADKSKINNQENNWSEIFADSVNPISKNNISEKLNNNIIE
jgi:hypothetical protein